MLKGFIRIQNAMRRLIRCQAGQGMAEYGLILALVAIVAIVGVMVLGPQLKQTFTNIASCVGKSANASSC